MGNSKRNFGLQSLRVGFGFARAVLPDLQIKRSADIPAETSGL